MNHLASSFVLLYFCFSFNSAALRSLPFTWGMTFPLLIPNETSKTEVSKWCINDSSPFLPYSVRQLSVHPSHFVAAVFLFISNNSIISDLSNTFYHRDFVIAVERSLP